MTQVNFAQLYNEFGGSEPIPDGEYDVQIAHANYKAARTGAAMIEGRLRVLTGPYANRVIVHNWVLTPDNPNAMFHWFRNFGILGLDSNFWNQLAASGYTTEQQLQYVATQIANKQAHISIKTTGTRQNVEGWAMLGATPPGAVPMPQTPVPGAGMQAQAPMPPLPQVGQPMQPGMPEMGQPASPVQVAPPPMPGQPAQPQPWDGQQQPQQVPMQPQAPAAGMPQQLPGMPGMPGAQPAAPQGAIPAMPAPPGYPQQAPNAPQAPVPAQVAPQPAVAPGQPAFPVPPGMPGMPDPNQQVQAQPQMPVPGTPPPQVPL
jgi:Protein of unknown function (DUF669)